MKDNNEIFVGGMAFEESPTCPYCGYKEKDAWEIDFGPGGEGEAEIECGKCDKRYLSSCLVYVHYTSYIKE